jgi:Nif-specific regulatory protein
VSDVVDSHEVTRLRLERDLLLRLLEIGANDDALPFLEASLSLIVGITRALKGYIELYGDDRESPPRFCIASGLSSEELRRVRKALSTGIIREALATGRAISTASAVEDPRFREHESVQAQGIRAVLCAPIGEPSIGVVYLTERPEPGPFSKDDLAYAQLFARHISPLAERLLVREQAAAESDYTVPFRARLLVPQIAGKSRALAEVFRLIAVAKDVALPVLFTGESGTGKSVFARALHDSSPRARGPFVEVNCAAVPEGLFESELFGAEKGAHSTADRRIEGKIDAAQKGTLFLDEVGDMPLSVQAKLLLFLQSRRYSRLGSNTPLDADVRVVAATNLDPQELVAAKRLREDLYYRLNVLGVHIPPLRARRADIEPIAEAIVHGLGERHDRALLLSRAAKVALAESEWPGNVRQLENALQRGWAVALSEGSPAIEPHHIFSERPAPTGQDSDETYEDATRRFQRSFLEQALARHGWNVTETARRISMARSHLNDLIRAHGLTRRRD